jgi:hypothetical protein
MDRLLVLAVVAGCAHAPVVASPPCPIDGDELYGIDDGPIADSDDAGAKLRVYPNGAWTYREHGGAAERGCLGPADVDRIKAALDGATWMQVAMPGPCAQPWRRAIYYVDGTAVYHTSCTAKLDEPTSRAVDAIDAIIRIARGR